MDRDLIQNWYCIYTKPKQEDFVTKRLIDVPGIEVFNPKVIKKTYARGGLKEVVEELFPCYVFSKFNPVKFFHLVRYTRGVRRIVGNKDPFIVDEGIIALIRSRMIEGFIKLEPFALKRGEQIVIKNGSFSGMKGIFLNDVGAKERVLILLHTLAYQARMEIDKCFLSKL